jgi:hypothetical protein
VRYYEIILSEPTKDGKQGRIVKQWQSHPGGKYDPGAQNIMFDSFVMPFDTFYGNSTITIEGISLDDLKQSQKFTGLQFSLKAGMAQGLPLANPRQAGLIATGTVLQSWGNWQGTEMTLDLVITPTEIWVDQPGNLVLNWMKGTPIKSALETSIHTAYPRAKIDVQVDPNMLLDFDCVGSYSSIISLMPVLKSAAAQIGKNIYSVYQAGTFLFFDDTYKPKPIPIDFVDLVGQPTWIATNTMQVTTVLRADIYMGAQIKMPAKFQNIPGLIQTTQDSWPSSNKYDSAFKGTFQVLDNRSVGNFRSPDGQSWVSIFNCVVS